MQRTAHDCPFSLEDGAPHGAGEETPRRGRPRSERAEKAIVAATLDLLAHHGIQGLSIEKVAERAGVAKTTVYRRWPGKAELVVDVIASIKGGPVVPPPGGNLRDDLVYVLTAMRDLATSSVASRVMTWVCAEMRNHPEIAELFWERVVRPQRQVIRDILERGVAEAAVDADHDLEMLTDLLTAPLTLRRIVWARPLPEQCVDRMVDTVLAGAAPRSPSAGTAVGYGTMQA